MPRSAKNSKPRAHHGANQLRIIAGQWRGRKLTFADQEGLRPTPDRVRETLFNWLQAYVAGAHCLDLFTGSGALALESLSRGATHATLLDSSREVINCLRENLEKLDCQDAQLLQQNALLWLTNNLQNKRYDLVFVDPPFRQNLIQPTCAALQEHDWLAPGAHIYIEAERNLQPLPVPTQWTLLKQKSAGQVCSYLYRYDGDDKVD